MLLPPRYWPANLWIPAGAVALLLLHAIGLAVQLVLVEMTGGIPRDLDALNAPAVSPFVESYSGQVIAGLAPGLVILGFGLAIAIPAARREDEAVASWGRIFVGALALLAVVLVGLALPWFGIDQ